MDLVAIEPGLDWDLPSGSLRARIPFPTVESWGTPIPIGWRGRDPRSFAVRWGSPSFSLVPSLLRGGERVEEREGMETNLASMRCACADAKEPPLPSLPGWRRKKGDVKIGTVLHLSHLPNRSEPEGGGAAPLVLVLLRREGTDRTTAFPFRPKGDSRWVEEIVDFASEIFLRVRTANVLTGKGGQSLRRTSTWWSRRETGREAWPSVRHTSRTTWRPNGSSSVRRPGALRPLQQSRATRAGCDRVVSAVFPTRSKSRLDPWLRSKG